jgi:hypothetical protein
MWSRPEEETYRKVRSQGALEDGNGDDIRSATDFEHRSVASVAT